MTSDSLTIDSDFLNLPVNTTLDGSPLADQDSIIGTAIFANLFLMGG